MGVFPSRGSPPSRRAAAGAGTGAGSVGKAATSRGPSAQHPALPGDKGTAAPETSRASSLLRRSGGERLQFASRPFQSHSQGRHIASAVPIAGAAKTMGGKKKEKKRNVFL